MQIWSVIKRDSVKNKKKETVKQIVAYPFSLLGSSIILFTSLIHSFIRSRIHLLAARHLPISRPTSITCACVFCIYPGTCNPLSLEVSPTGIFYRSLLIFFHMHYRNSYIKINIDWSRLWEEQEIIYLTAEFKELKFIYFIIL